MSDPRFAFYTIRFLAKLIASGGRALLRIVRGISAAHWPVTEAVVQAVLCPEEDGIFSVRIDYEYSVNQQYYFGSFSRECLGKTLGKRFATGFQQRAHYLVHYDPNHPERSYLPSKPMLVRMAAAARF